MEAHESLGAYRFDDFVLDPGAFRLARHEEEIPLEPKAIDLLLYLVQRPGQLASKEELISAIWMGTAVTDNALTRVVAQLRRALGDDAHGARYIETVPTRGYRFIAQPTRTVSPELPGTPHLAKPVPLVGDTKPQQRSWAWPAWAALALAMSLTAVVVAWRVRPRLFSEPTLPRPSSLAVLPLRNLTGDVDQDYFVAGMTEALAAKLSQIRTLTVAAATSTMRYRHSTLPASRIARELGVDSLLEGAVFREANRVRVTVALIHGSSERRLWSATYDRPISDVLALYNDVALTLADEMRLAVTEAQQALLSQSRTVHPEAYEAYLRGSYFVGNRWMAGGCRDAERYLLRAIELAPEFAPPYATLAWCYAYPDRTGRHIEDIGPKAKAAVKTALALDDSLALAHLVLGTILWRVEYDPIAAEAELRRALELDSSSGLVHIPYGEWLLWHGQREQGLALLNRAVQLEPFSPDRNVQVGFCLLTVGLYDQAIARLRAALELDPHYATAQLWIAEAYAYKNQYDAAVAEYLKWLDGSLRPARAAGARATLAAAYARGGWLGFWRAELALAEEDAARPGSVWKPPYHRYTGVWSMARRYARLGERRRALRALERAYQARHHMMAVLPLEPLFQGLRHDAQFQALLRETGALSTADVVLAPRHAGGAGAGS
jgi:DNA-binding winged helix-turn-helix (wHTH) protein/TolB-like protein